MTASATRVKALGDIVEFLDSKRRPVKAEDRNPGPYPYYGANGKQGTIDGYIFDEPLVLLAEDGGHFFEPQRGIAYRISGKTWVNNHAHVLRPKQGLDRDYLCLALRHLDVTPHLSGTTRAKLTKAGASNIQVPVPPMAQQKRIAGVLDATDVVRAKRRESLAQLDSLLQSTFLDMFGDPAANPMGWDSARLNEVCDFVAGYAWKAALFNKDLKGSPVIRIQNVGTEVSELVHTSEAPIERFWVEHGDLLLSLSGSFRLATWDKPRALLNQRIVKITPRVVTDLQYFKAALGSRLLAIEALGRHALVNNVALSDLRKLKICIPPLKAQHRFATIVESVERQKTLMRAHLGELDTLFGSLHYRAFSAPL